MALDLAHILNLIFLFYYQGAKKDTWWKSRKGNWLGKNMCISHAMKIKWWKWGTIKETSHFIKQKSNVCLENTLSFMAQLKFHYLHEPLGPPRKNHPLFPSLRQSTWNRLYSTSTTCPSLLCLCLQTRSLKAEQIAVWICLSHAWNSACYEVNAPRIFVKWQVWRRTLWYHAEGRAITQQNAVEFNCIFRILSLLSHFLLHMPLLLQLPYLWEVACRPKLQPMGPQPPSFS